MPVEFYEYELSPFCRSVKLISKLINVPLESIQINLKKEEQKTPEYLEKNPFHKVPTINDNGFYLAESRAIGTYLIDKYAPDHSLYPKDLNKRAAINQMMYFDCGTLSPAHTGLSDPFYYENKLAPPEAIEKARDAYKTLDLILSKRKYVAGDSLTIADIVIRATLSMNEYIVFMDVSEFKNIASWKQKVKDETSPAYIEVNDMVTEKKKAFIDAVNSNLQKLKGK